jgi:pimeloyl-ACP methyl ester carboxylesterase
MFLLVSSPPPSLLAQAPVEGKNTVVIRGQPQDIYFHPARLQPGAQESKRLYGKILFAPGDGGWRGFAITIAETIASWGYDVYGLDTRRYLESFTGKTTLKETEVMSDFRQIAGWMTQGASEGVTLVGWSEGAGLCLLAAASGENKKAFSGLVSIGLSESSVLGWRWSDLLSSIAGREPKEPTFASASFLAQVAPLPLLMIQASGDQYVSVEAAKRMFALAQEPKRFVLVDAQNHRFDGNRDGFFGILHEGLQWMNEMPH